MRYRLAVLITAAVALVFCLTGCGDKGGSRAPSPVPAKRVASRQVTKSVKTIVKAEEATPVPPSPYVYNPAGQRDPFHPLLMVKKPLVETAPLTPLQKYDLGQLRLIGVIIGMGSPRAMVVAPDGKSYVLKPGTKVGKNGGKVVRITQRTVVVEERYQDYLGQVKTSVQKIQLPKQEGVE